jgi:asparagine synthase (glutamine-hydrolysing)
MCAIAGVFNYKYIDLEAIRDSMLHRGPDSQNIYKYENLALIHNRLSIQDIENGAQPFHYEEFSIVFNGEIYNHLELRESLKEFEFKTHSDTETLLYLFVKFREEMFTMLDGMFAFAIFDKRENSLFLARDRAGKKPLYYSKVSDRFIFASELNAFKIEKEIDEEAVYSYLRAGFLFDSSTIYKDIFELSSGSYIEVNLPNLEIKTEQYFNILDFYQNKSSLNLEDSLQKVDDLLHKSIKDRLLSSDLEVGAFLSGGIDSSLIVAIASQYRKNLKTFTVNFDRGYSEAWLAKLTAQKYRTEHTEIEISMNLRDDIEKILCNYGEPFMDSSAIPSYYVSKEAKKHLTVILNGDGADELFGGYRRYVGAKLTDVAKHFRFALKFLKKPHNKQSLYNYLYRLLSMADKSGLEFYLSSRIDIFEDCYSFERGSTELKKFIEKSENLNLSTVDKMLYEDFNTLLFGDLLVKMDIATMANSLEGRSPFLSKYMLEFAPSLNENFKVKNSTTKYILRELSKKYLPKEVLHQPKRGFEVPLKSWIDNELKENIFDSLQSGCYSSNYIEQKFITDVLNRDVDISDEKRAKILWTLYSLEVFYKNFKKEEQRFDFKH